MRAFAFRAYYGLISNTNTALASSFDKLKTSTGKVFLSKHYIFFNFFQIDALGIKYLNLSLSFILNVLDKSIIVFPTLTYSPYQNIDIQLYFRIFLGRDSTEFGDYQNFFVLGLKVKISF